MLRIQLLGAGEFRDRGGRPLALTARKCRALLAFLALQGGAAQSRERLAALLWEDDDPPQARTSLRQALTAIRRALPERDRTALVADTQSVALDAARVEVDVLALRALLEESTVASLKAALPLSAGSLLEGFDARSGAFDEWLAGERRALRRDVASAMQLLARLCRESGDAGGETDALARLTLLEPLNEPAHRELMDALARAGRYTDALRQYQVCRALLRRELDLAPEPATETLYRELMKKRRAATGEDFEPLASGPPEILAAAASPVTARDDRMLRNAVVLAVRLVDYAARRRELDPEDARELTQRLQQHFDAAVAQNGGTADRLSADRLCAVFGLDGIRGNETDRAMQAAAAFRAALAVDAAGWLPPAAAIAQGALLPSRTAGPFPLAGAPMVEAEALAARAESGETILSENLHRELGVRPMPFAGRHAELDQMVSLLDRTIEDERGRAILVRGEAGIGKTRLVDALAEIAAARGVGIHRVQVLDFGQVKARRPLAALFTSLLGLEPDAPPVVRAQAVEEAIAAGRLPADSILHASGLANAALAPELASIERNVEPRALEHGRSEAVRRLIHSACEESPLLLVIEDLHWAGGEEAARLGELAAAITGVRALLVMSTRPDEDPIDTAWRTRARGCPLTTLDLAPLADEEARELAAAYPELPEPVVDDCIARAQGHPLFLDQLLRAAGAGERALPGTVQALVLARVERLPPADRRTLQSASVLGLRFPRAALATMEGGEAPVLDGLVAAGMLAQDGGEIAFVHALMREAVYSSLVTSARRELHARAASWYVNRDPGIRAGHLVEAADPGAVRACLEAAAAEADAFRLDRALEFARKASELARDPADFGAARCLLGELQTRTGHTHDAIATFREVVDLRSGALQDARGWLGLANALRIVDRYDEALGALDRAESALAGRGEPALLARISTLRGNIHFPRGELTACLEAHERALGFAREARSAVDEARALGGLGDAWYQRGRLRTARDHFASCVAAAREHGAIGLALSHAPMHAITRAFCGEFREGLADCVETAAAARRAGDPRSELLALDTEAGIALHCADYGRVRATAERGLALARQLGARRFETELLALLGLALANQGVGADAQVLLRQATALALEIAPTYCGPWCLGAQALFAPNADRAHALLGQGEALLARGCVSHNHLEFHRLAAEFHLRHAELREARRHAAALAAYTQEEPLAWSELVVRRIHCLADRAEDPAQPGLAARIAELNRDAAACGFDWCRA